MIPIYIGLDAQWIRYSGLKSSKRYKFIHFKLNNNNNKASSEFKHLCERIRHLRFCFLVERSRVSFKATFIPCLFPCKAKRSLCTQSSALPTYISIKVGKVEKIRSSCRSPNSFYFCFPSFFLLWQSPLSSALHLQMLFFIQLNYINAAETLYFRALRVEGDRIISFVVCSLHVPVLGNFIQFISGLHSFIVELASIHRHSIMYLHR